MVDLPPPSRGPGDNATGGGASDNVAAALSAAAASPPAAPSETPDGNAWRSVVGGWRGAMTAAAASVVSRPGAAAADGGDPPRSRVASPPSSGNAAAAALSSFAGQLTSSVGALDISTLSRNLSHNITGRNTLPDKTTASQVLMFRQLLHTKCRPGLRLSRKYEGTAAQKAVLHMPWWERGIEQSKKMIISYDNLITRLWLSGAIMPFEKDGYAAGTAAGSEASPPGGGGAVDTLINERGLPPVPHPHWVDRLGFQQDDPVTDFRSGGVLSLAMLVHIVESCPIIHSRFVPKHSANDATAMPISTTISLDEIITDDASVLPFGITCINITDMLAKFLLFTKAIDKMDALLSAKPFWKMFIDPNAMLVLQEVSLDLLCDVCVEIGRERRIARLEAAIGQESGGDGPQFPEVVAGMPGSQDGKVTVFDFSEIMERTEKRVRDEVLGPGPRNIEELRAVARRVKSKYLLRIQLKEQHSPSAKLNHNMMKPPSSSDMLMKNVTTSVIGGVGDVTSSVLGGVGGLVSRLKKPLPPSPSPGSSAATDGNAAAVDGRDASSTAEGRGGGVPPDITPSLPAESVATPRSDSTMEEVDELERLSAELGDLSAATAEAFDLLGDDFDGTDIDEELLDAMDGRVDPLAAFPTDDHDFLS